MNAKIDFSSSVISINDKEYPLPPVGIAAQEMIVTGGLENWVKEKIKNKKGDYVKT